MKTKLILLALLLLSLPSTAQKHKVQKLTPEQMERQAKLQRITDNTQRIIIIDSTVVDKQHFLQAYHLSKETGRIARYEDFFHTSQQPNSFVYVNDLSNRCILSQEQTDSTIALYTSTIVNNRWTTPTPLQGINEEFRHANYPFMMGDGITFYFAADGKDGLGGYDIYVTRYDAEENSFLHPANIGMPFNSEANDYMYVIDEYNNLGWFATDRRQPEDSVCIYVFIPQTNRKTYSADGLTTEEIARFARIDRIADTWTDEALVSAAKCRLSAITSPAPDRSVTKDNIHFVINDNITYTRLTDFCAPGNADNYRQLADLQKRLQSLTQVLSQARDYYYSANSEERDELKPEILSSEQKQYELRLSIRQLEKQIRNNEITFLTKNK